MFAKILIYSPLWITGVLLYILGVVYVFPSIGGAYQGLAVQILTIMLSSISVWLPLVLGFAFWGVWVQYVRADWLSKMKWVVLEIKIPQEVTKSPLAMETFFMSLHQTGGETTWIDRNWKGQVRPYYSLEIISIEGNVKFVMYVQDRHKKFIESGLYAQYSNIEIHEIPDYTHSISYDSKEMDLYVIDFKKKEPDPYPIKTYIDYGIENEQMEENTKIDPINSVVEFLGSIGANQQAWLQIVIRAHKKEKRGFAVFHKSDPWKDDAKREIEKIRAEALPKGSDGTKFPNPTKGQQERISALERTVSKLPFDAGIRVVYFGKKDFFNGSNITGIRTLLRSYSAQHLNSFGPTNWLDGFDYPWEDFRGIRKESKKRHGLLAYKRRAFFYGPHSEEAEIMVLTVEELATMFHIPGQVVQTPTLGRLVSKKGQAPGNLPI